MNLKKIFRPSLTKLALTSSIFLFLPVIPVKFLPFDAPSYILNVSPLSAIIWDLDTIRYPFVPVLALFAVYFLACLLIYLYADRIPSEVKSLLWKKLKPSKGRIIVATLGWVVIGLFIVQSFAPLFRSLYQYYQTVGLILLPVSIFMYHLFLGNISLVKSILCFSEIPPSEGGCVGSFVLIWNTGALSNLGRILIFPLLIVEWYLLSCLLVYLFNKAQRFLVAS